MLAMNRIVDKPQTVMNINSKLFEALWERKVAGEWQCSAQFHTSNAVEVGE